MAKISNIQSGHATEANRPTMDVTYAAGGLPGSLSLVGVGT